MFFFKQKTAYEVRISDWSSDVCSSDLNVINLMDALKASLGEAKPAAKSKAKAPAAAPKESAAKASLKAALEASKAAAPKAAAKKKDRKSVGQGKSGSVRVELGGRRILKKKQPH